MKLSLINYDVVDFALNDKLEKIAELVQPLSEKAKTAYIPTYENQLERPEKDFAVVLVDHSAGNLKKYACYTPELVELNMAFLVDQMKSLPDEIVKTAAQNLTCAAKKFKVNVPEELALFKSARYVSRTIDLDKIDSIKFNEKLAACKSKMKSKKNALRGKYPIDTKENIKKASQWFDKNFSKLSIEDTMEFVNNLTKEATEQNVTLEKTAAYTFSQLDPTTFNPDFYNHISIRKSYLSDDNEEGREAYNELIKRADELGTVKIAYLIDMLDEENNLKYLYGTKLVDPLRVTMGFKKTAGIEIDDRFVSLNDLKKVANENLTNIVGTDMIKDLKGPEGLDILASLPKPVRLEILELM